MDIKTEQLKQIIKEEVDNHMVVKGLFRVASKLARQASKLTRSPDAAAMHMQDAADILAVAAVFHTGNTKKAVRMVRKLDTEPRDLALEAIPEHILNDGGGPKNRPRHGV